MAKEAEHSSEEKEVTKDTEVKKDHGKVEKHEETHTKDTKDKKKKDTDHAAPAPAVVHHAPAPVHAAPAHAPHALSHVNDKSYWDSLRDTVRSPLKKTLLIGAIAASPLLAGTVWGGDKILRKTVSKIPVLGQVYEKPRAAILDIANKTHEAIVSTVTSPAIVLDTVRDVKDGLVGKKSLEAKGIVGRAIESTVEKAFSVPGSILRGTKNVGSAILNDAKEILVEAKDALVGVAKQYFRILRRHPIITPIVTFGTIGGFAELGPLGFPKEMWTIGSGLLKGFAQLIQAVASWIS